MNIERAIGKLSSLALGKAKNAHPDYIAQVYREACRAVNDAATSWWSYQERRSRGEHLPDIHPYVSPEAVLAILAAEGNAADLGVVARFRAIVESVRAQRTAEWLQSR